MWPSRAWTISAGPALSLGIYFGLAAQLRLNLENEYDLRRARANASLDKVKLQGRLCFRNPTAMPAASCVSRGDGGHLFQRVTSLLGD
jgi:hypothetical protein